MIIPENLFEKQTLSEVKDGYMGLRSESKEG
jgi:hypothetical protein